MYTSGAIILTNDGDFVYKVTHPKHEIEKTYIAQIKGKIIEEEIQMLRNGIEIEPGITTQKAKVKLIEYNGKTGNSQIEITIHEGKNRQVRKMLEALDKEVKKLHRSQIGNLNVDDLKLGKWRYLRKGEIKRLFENNCNNK